MFEYFVYGHLLKTKSFPLLSKEILEIIENSYFRNCILGHGVDLSTWGTEIPPIELNRKIKQLCK